MKTVLSSLLLLFLVGFHPAFADQAIYPRFTEDQVEARTAGKSENFGILEVLQRGKTVQCLLRRDRDSDDRRGSRDPLLLVINTKNEKTAEILAQTFDWNTEVSLIVLADLSSGSRWTIPQSQVLFQDVDGVLAGERGHGRTQVLTIDDLINAVKSNS